MPGLPCPLYVCVMALSLTTAPSVEPLTTAEAKTALRLDYSNDDGLIDDFIEAARADAETFTYRAFLNQTYVLRLTSFPWGPILLPRPPLSSVTSVTYIDTAGDSQTWSSSLYTVETPSGERALHATIRPISGGVYPATQRVVDAVTITFVAGYGAASSSLPESIRRGVAQRCQQLYDGEENEPMPSVLWPYLAWRADLRFD